MDGKVGTSTFGQRPKKTPAARYNRIVQCQWNHSGYLYFYFEFYRRIRVFPFEHPKLSSVIPMLCCSFTNCSYFMDT